MVTTKNSTATRVDVCRSAPGSCYKETEEETATLDAYLALSPYFRSLKADASLPGFESPRALAYTIEHHGYRGDPRRRGDHVRGALV